LLLVSQVLVADHRYSTSAGTTSSGDCSRAFAGT
jgi:hypothetical protein